MEQLTIGTELYNHGDRVNSPKTGIITNIIVNPYFAGYEVQWKDGGKDRIYFSSVDPIFKGHSGTRIVPLAAYKAWKEDQYNKVMADIDRRRREREAAAI